MNVVSVTNAHGFLLLQIFFCSDFIVGVIALGQPDGQTGQLKQAAIIGDKAGFFPRDGGKRLGVECAAEALRRLHGVERGAVRRVQHAARRVCDLHRILDGHCGRGCAGLGGSGQCGGDDVLADKGAGGVVDGNKLARRRGQTVAHAVGAGRAALYDGAGLGTGGGDGLAGSAVAAADQHKLGNCRVRSQCGTACLQHGAAIRQTVAQFVKAHTAGCPCRHHNGGHGGKIRLCHGHTAPFTYL